MFDGNPEELLTEELKAKLGDYDFKVPLPATLAGRTVCFDVEADNLLDKVTKMHCLWIGDVDTGEEWDFADQPGFYPIADGVTLLMTAESTVAHNGIDYDERCIAKFHPYFVPPPCNDTLVIAKVLFPSERLWDLDMKQVKVGRLPQKYARRQSLEAWGFRLGCQKYHYAGGWEAWSMEMHLYCRQDIRTNIVIWKKFKERLGWVAEVPQDYSYPEIAIRTEIEVYREILDQKENGFGFDRQAAIALTAQLANRKAQIERQLVEVFGEWWEPLDDPATGHKPASARSEKLTHLPDITIPRYGKTGKRLKDYVGPPLAHYSHDAPLVRIRRVTFNPGSRDHLADRLIALYGWKPTEFGDDKKPTLGEEIIKAFPPTLLPTHVKDLILEYFVTAKTYGMLAEGRQSWLKKYNEATGAVHGRVDPLAANTGRGIHSDPNLSQVPKVILDKNKEPLRGYAGRYGWECRGLFKPRTAGWEETGTDVSSLEFVELGDALAEFDEGAFRARTDDPAMDLHTENARLTGLSRADTKTVGYAYLYGAGPLLIGIAVGYTADELEYLLSHPKLTGYVKFIKEKMGDKFVPFTEHQLACIAKGYDVIAKFEAGITGLKELKDKLRKFAKEHRYVISISGRKIYIKKDHTVLNYYLQGGGADICKLWIVMMHKRLAALGYRKKIDYNQMGWFHDEVQFEHRPGLGPVIKEASSWAIREAGRLLGVVSILRTESKTGRHWAECH